MTLQWLDAGGKRQPLPTQPGPYGFARLSPDGNRLVTGGSQQAAVQTVQVYDLQRETWSGLTFDPGVHVNPVWSPDGRFVVFGSLTGLWGTRADGSGQPQPLTSGQLIQAPYSISPDGKRVAYIEVGGASGAGGTQIWTLPLEENGSDLKVGTPQQFLTSQFLDATPAFSPDGKWIAYASTGPSNPEIFVRAFPDNGGLWKISTNGGTNPVWSRSASELLYQEGDQIMAVRLFRERWRIRSRSSPRMGSAGGRNIPGLVGGREARADSIARRSPGSAPHPARGGADPELPRRIEAENPVGEMTRWL